MIKNTKVFLKLNPILIGIILFLSLFYLPRLGLTCPVFNSLSFDSQASFLWYYTAAKGLLPYRDIFFPYGLLHYYKDIYILPHAIFVILTPLMLLLAFVLLTKAWKNQVLPAIFFLLFFLFVNIFSGEAFSSYGSVVIIGTSFALLFSGGKVSNKTAIVTGVGCGILFSILHPQGTYLSIIFLSGLTISYYLNNKINLKIMTALLGKFVLFISGFVIGLFPFFVWLAVNHALVPFFDFINHLPDITSYGKTPFIPFSTTPSNLFTFAVFIPSLFYVCYILLEKKKKADQRDYIIIQLVLVIFLLENISIVRSIDSLITFASFFLLIILFSFGNNIFIKKGKEFYILTTIYIFILFTIFFEIKLPVVKTLYEHSNLTSINECINKTASLLTKNTNFEKVSEYMRGNGGALNPKIFSFPSDVVFYIMFDRNPPIYLLSYASSGFYNEQKQIDFIKKNTDYIIYNTEAESEQDNVPNYARTPYQMQYIFNNFFPQRQIGNFLIFKKGEDDLFHDKNIMNDNFVGHLLSPDFGAIFKTEGKKVSKHQHINYLDLKSLNEYLSKNLVNSSGKFLLMLQTGVINSPTKITLHFETKDGLKSNVAFQQCGYNSLCLADLSKIPVFYKTRDITKVEIKPDVFLTKILTLPKGGNLW